jgi:hypothetical protein
MAFAVVRRTWGPDSIPGVRRTGSPALDTRTVALADTREQADRLARTSVLAFAAKGYNMRLGYWWGRDTRFRYTFAVEPAAR